MAIRQSAYNPALQNAPLNLYNTSAPGTPYASEYQNVVTKLLLAPDIDPTLKPSFPQQFKDIAWLMSRRRRDVTDLRYHWHENPWIHVPVVVRASAAAVQATPNTEVTSTIGIADGSYDYVSVGDKLVIHGENVIVIAKSAYTSNNSTIDVRSLRGRGIPAVAADDELTNHGPMAADGFSTVYSQGMVEQILYHNVLEKGRSRQVRFDPLQKKSLQFNAKIDQVTRAVQEAEMSALTAMQARAWMSRYGITTMPDGASITSSTSGILEQMENAGVTEQLVSTTQAADAIKEIVFDTAMSNSSRKVLVGTTRSLQAVGQMQKADKVRYTVDGEEWNMNIYSYDFYGHEVVCLPMDVWNDAGLYSGLSDTILVLDEDNAVLNYFRSEPILSRKYTLINTKDTPSGPNDFESMWYEYLFGIQLENAWATGRLRLKA